MARQKKDTEDFAGAKELREKFRYSIAEKISSLQQLHSNALKNPGNESIGMLREEVHKLAGSAGSYGFPMAS